MVSIYDDLAGQYVDRIGQFETSDLIIVGPFSLYLRATFPNIDVSCLEIGSGAGLNSRMLIDEGFKVTAVENSSMMCNATKEFAPNASVVCEDFLDWECAPNSFHGIFAKAVLHLFALEDARRFLEKCSSLLTAGGLLYVAVTKGDEESEEVIPKDDYKGQPMRLKRKWTADALFREMKAAGLSPIYCSSKELDPKGKSWLSMWAVRAD